MHKAYCKLKGISFSEIYFFGHTNKPIYIYTDGDGIGDTGHSNGFGGKNYGGGFAHSVSHGDWDGFGCHEYLRNIMEDVGEEYSSLTFSKPFFLDEEEI